MIQETLPLLEAVIKSHGIEHYGFSPLKNPLTLSHYEKWLSQGLQGEMKYLEDHLPVKKDPEARFQGLYSAIVITKPYFPQNQNEETLLPGLRVAEYARQKDYHLTFQKELEVLKEKLQFAFAGEEFLCFTDAVPLLERDLAVRASLGWVGKNTCLIDRKKGSLFFIGEILTSLSLENQKPLVSDFCGSCRRCIDICPTGALTERVLDARSCISYLTIEAHSLPPENLRAQMGDWFFGCDLCQTVCPWNEKAHGKDLMKELSKERRTQATPETVRTLKTLLVTSNKKLMESLKESPLSRARGFGLKRNALIVIKELGLKELKEEVLHTSRQWPRLKELCDWVLESFEDL